nr:MAG TPA: hypothetical protein [Bacteriophage sp.]
MLDISKLRIHSVSYSRTITSSCHIPLESFTITTKRNIIYSISNLIILISKFLPNGIL